MKVYGTIPPRELDLPLARDLTVTLEYPCSVPRAVRFTGDASDKRIKAYYRGAYQCQCGSRHEPLVTLADTALKEEEAVPSE